MELGEIIGYVLTALGGGGLTALFTLKSSRKKADVEVKVNEIEAIHQTIEKVYQPIINQQNTRIQELEDEVKALRKQLADERADHQKEIDMMNKRILAITSALGLKADKQIRNAKGQYTSKKEEGDETEG